MAAPTDLDRGGYEVLDHPTCLSLLSSGGLGRVGVSVDALPMILPVHFSFRDGLVEFRTLAGSTLDRATRQAVIAFETDGTDDELRHWSVTITGVARHLPSCADDPMLLVAIDTDRVSGRRQVAPALTSGEAPSSADEHLRPLGR
jgi:hypothetical protein